jgi:hypothetical protein
VALAGAGQTLVHAPQWFGSFDSLKHALPLHSVKPALQAKEHALLAHVACALATDVVQA